jgi:hypothetical protein
MRMFMLIQEPSLFGGFLKGHLRAIWAALVRHVLYPFL